MFHNSLTINNLQLTTKLLWLIMRNNEILACVISFFKVLVKKAREKWPRPDGKGVCSLIVRPDRGQKAYLDFASDHATTRVENSSTCWPPKVEIERFGGCKKSGYVLANLSAPMYSRKPDRFFRVYLNHSSKLFSLYDYFILVLNYG